MGAFDLRGANLHMAALCDSRLVIGTRCPDAGWSTYIAFRSTARLKDVPALGPWPGAHCCRKK